VGKLAKIWASLPRSSLSGGAVSYYEGQRALSVKQLEDQFYKRVGASAI